MIIFACGEDLKQVLFISYPLNLTGILLSYAVPEQFNVSVVRCRWWVAQIKIIKIIQNQL